MRRDVLQSEMMPDLHIRVSKELLTKLKLLADQSNMSLHDFVKMYLERLAHRDSHIRISTSEQAHENEHINSSTSGLAHKVEHIKTSTSERVSDPEDTERILKEIRRLEDLVNAYTSKTDQTLQRLSQLVEALESLNEKLDKVVEMLSKQQVLTKLSEEKSKTSEERSVKRRSVCEILEEQHVIFESDVVAKGIIRDRDSFFASIESRCGDVVIECSRERVAVEKSFWQSFLSKVSKISTTDDEKIKNELDSLEYRLFKTLKESALLVFDAVKRQWVFVAQKSTSTGTVASTVTRAISTSVDTENSTEASHAGTSTSTESNNRSKRYYKKKSHEDGESWILQYVDSE